MINSLLSEMRHIITMLAIIIVASAALFTYGYVELHRPVQHTTPVSVVTPDPAKEVQAIVEAGKALAASQGPAPIFAQPAVSVIHDVVPGLTPGEIAQILQGLKPPTREAVSASSKLVGPSPAPKPTAVAGLTADELAAIEQADKSALTDVLADPKTHIATTVSVTQEEVQPTRVGSLFSVNGAGLDVALVRKGHFEINLGAIVRGTHLFPVIQPAWMLPGTSVSIGPSFSYDHRFIAGVAASVHF